MVIVTFPGLVLLTLYLNFLSVASTGRKVAYRDVHDQTTN